MSARVSIEVDGPARVGEALGVTVIVEAGQRGEFSGLTLALRGVSMVLGREAAIDIPVEEKKLAPAFHLKRGERRRFEATITLPADVPPTCEGDVTVSYVLVARLGVPWWFDTTAEAIPIILPREPLDRPPRKPVTVATSSRAEVSLYLEVTVDDTAWAPGETLTGAFSIGNITGARLDGSSVSIDAAPGATGVAIAGERSTFKSLVGLAEGGVIRFAIPIPAGTVSSFQSRVCSVERVVTVYVDGWQQSCSVPIVIDDWPAREGRIEAGEPLGGERWRAAWREEGARLGLDLARTGLDLRGTLAGGAITARVRSRGSQLAAELSWHSFGIGLRVQRRGLLMLSGVDLDEVHAAFASRFAARGREEAQARAALDFSLCAALVAFDDVEVHDRGAALARAAPARDRDALRAFLDALAEAAQELAAAPDRLPPPAWIDEASLAAHRAFAEVTGATLRLGPMSLSGGIVEGERVDVEIIPEGGPPERTRVVLHVELDIDPDQYGLRAPTTEIARAVEAITDRPWDLGGIRDELRLDIGAPIPDPAVLRPVVIALSRFAARLRGDAESRGPYR